MMEWKDVFIIFSLAVLFVGGVLVGVKINNDYDYKMAELGFAYYQSGWHKIPELKK